MASIGNDGGGLQDSDHQYQHEEEGMASMTIGEEGDAMSIGEEEEGMASMTIREEEEEGTNGEEQGYDKEDPLSLPLGIRFQPTDEELIVLYLSKKDAGQPIVLENMILDCDVYQKEPWNLPREQLYGLGKDVYYFTQVTKLSTRGYRVSRTAGSGYWHANGSHVKIRHGGKLVGHSMQLKYIQKVNGKEIGTCWVMHEFRLDRPAGEKIKGDEETVLCRIRPSGRGDSEHPIQEASDGSKDCGSQAPEPKKARYGDNLGNSILDDSMKQLEKCLRGFQEPRRNMHE